MDRIRNSLGSNDSDILPTGRHRPVSNRYSTGNLSDDSERKPYGILFFVNLLLVGLIMYIVVNQQSKYSTLNGRINTILEKEKKTNTITDGLNEQLKVERSRKEELQRTLQAKNDNFNAIKQEIEQEKSKYKTLDQENEQLLESGKNKIGKTVSMLGHAYGEDQLKARFQKQKQNVDLLRNRLRDMSRREVLERFGPGPHRVKFDVFLPPLPGSTEKQHASFVVETAPLDTMPHAVHLFLEQVYHHLWDGCSFLLCDKHRLQASPFRDMQLMDNSLEKKFKQLDLDTVAFQEYNVTYPHDKWTLGYSGRPGGPDFYINIDDNVARFGPAGKESKVLEEEADPAFARVVVGIDVIEKMMSLPKISVNGDLFKESVVIVQANLVGIKPGQYRHSFYDGGYVSLHDQEYYADSGGQ